MLETHLRKTVGPAKVIRLLEIPLPINYVVTTQKAVEDKTAWYRTIQSPLKVVRTDEFQRTLDQVAFIHTNFYVIKHKKYEYKSDIRSI